MKTVVFAYGDFGCTGIEQLLAAGYDVRRVYTHPDNPSEKQYRRSVAALCAQRALPLRVAEGAVPQADIAALAAPAPDYIFAFYWRSLLPLPLLELARRGAFNLHGSLLPHYRGRAPLNWVLVRGETATGVTLHHMVARADAGDIVAQAPVPIAYEDTAFTLQQKLLAASAELLARHLPLIAGGSAARTPQDLSQGSYFGRRTPEDGRIDWRLPAEAVRNLVRAVTHPFPGAFSELQGCRVFIWDASVVQAEAAPGMVVSAAPLVVACGTGGLLIRSAQLEGGAQAAGETLAVTLGLSAGAAIAGPPDGAGHCG
jgi:UDP-4-amino-4-deoxy-L-arabinose formyltransferase/UDP-glucuronic acid dehydrogenase (UDP-4-keto-hexauronic acid decarboxylating)